jgi:hypothetical protein
MFFFFEEFSQLLNSPGLQLHVDDRDTSEYMISNGLPGLYLCVLVGD